MAGQHFCVLRVRVPLLPPRGYSGLLWRTESLAKGLTGFPSQLRLLFTRLDACVLDKRFSPQHAQVEW
jgi:hypothetical protein